MEQWITAINEEAKAATPAQEPRSSKSLKKSKSRQTMAIDEKPPQEEQEEKAKTKNRLTKFLSSRPTADSLEKSGILVQGTLLFGGKIQNHWDVGGGKIPRIILECIDAVQKKGLQSTGIYRLSGNSADIQKLRILYNQNEQVNLLTDPRWFDINAVTGVLKLYFRELQEPLITFALFDPLIQACKIETASDRALAIKNFIRRLPLANYEILKFLIFHLHNISENASINKMDTANLAIVFGPTLMRPEHESMEMIMNMGYQNSVVEHLIVQAHWMFE